MSSVSIALTDEAIRKCYSVMVQLRPHLSEEAFLSQVQRQMSEGYHLAYIANHGQVVAVAGYRLSETLAWGKFLYVDDLITDEQQRSSGYGKKLLSWLKQDAEEYGCAQFHLDSGIQRKDAHRFYEREGMSVNSYHFAITELEE